jgi:competence protein ComEC
VDAEAGAAGARRPLLACSLALLAGSLAGADSYREALPWAAAAAAAAGFALGSQSSARARLALAAGLAFLTLLQASRASVAAEVLARPWCPCAVEGIWRPVLESAEASLGVLESVPGRAPLFELPPGSAVAGERLRLNPAQGPSRPARGPFPSRRDAPGSVRVHPDEIERLAPSTGRIEGLRAVLLERCDQLGDARTAGLARALLLGDRSRLDASAVDPYTRTGVNHLLAVSGQHVVLFAALFAGPLAWVVLRASLGRGAKQRDSSRVLAALGVLLYSLLAGGAAPVRRAALAAAVALMAPLVPTRRGARGTRSVDGLSAWGGALMLELAVDPLGARGIGVQLSYAATLGLICGVRPIERLMGHCVPADPPALQRSQATRWAAAIGSRLARAGALTFAASAAAVIATLPIVWFRFGEWSPIGIVLTPLAVAVLGWVLPIGWLSLIAPQTLGPPLFAPGVRLLEALVELSDRLPGTPCPLPDRPAEALALAGIATLGAVLASTIAWRRLFIRTAALAWCVLLLPWQAEPATLQLVALEVGHGTAVAFRAPDAGTWIFDAGSKDRSGVGPDALAPLLARWDPGRVAVILSHDQADHASGLPWLVERWNPWLTGGAVSARVSERLPHAALRLDPGKGRVALPVGGASSGLTLELIRGSTAPGNEGSRSLLLAWEGRVLLLSGDAEGEGLGPLLELEASSAPLELLLAPHHGSHTALLGAMLDTLRPRGVWVSGSGPPPIAAELERRGIAWRSTELDGPLSLEWPRDEPLVGPRHSNR